MHETSWLVALLHVGTVCGFYVVYSWSRCPVLHGEQLQEQEEALPALPPQLFAIGPESSTGSQALALMLLSFL